MFDPSEPGAIANAIAELHTNAALRQDLIVRGYRRLRDFDCDRTARTYRAVYRCAARRPLTAEDRDLLAQDGMPEAAALARRHR
jgi:hypothetical protein